MGLQVCVCVGMECEVAQAKGSKMYKRASRDKDTKVYGKTFFVSARLYIYKQLVKSLSTHTQCV